MPKDARGTDDRVSFRRFPLTFTLVGLNVGMLLVAGIRSGHLGGIFDPDPSVLCRLGAGNTQATLGQPSQWWLGPVLRHPEVRAEFSNWHR